MNVRIRTRGLRLGKNLRSHVERRAFFALDRFEDRIERVDVRLEDANGPRGGEDKLCRVEVRLRGAPVPVRVSDRSADAASAFDRAVHRAGRAVAKAVDRERQTLLELLALARFANGPA
jgi:ribosomal subunit interface protein